MDKRSAKKRPRSVTPSKAGGGGAVSDSSSSPRKKSKQKKTKRSRANSDVSSALRRKKTTETATASGEVMAQMISTFTKAEQSRFEAFQCASIDSQAVREWLAACLAHRHGLASTSTTTTTKQPQQLSDWTGNAEQAQDIAMVVATLAKIYAQRLVATAKSMGGAASASENTTTSSTATSSSPKSATSASVLERQPLQPDDILAAWQQRTAQGLDPGFFLQAHSDAVGGATGMTNGTMVGGGQQPRQSSDYYQRRLAALAAQDAYDKLHKRGGDNGDKDEEDAQKPNDNNEENAAGSPMQVDDKEES